MMAMQGFSGWRLGAWTRSVLSGGSRIGLCPPDIAGREREGCGCGRREGRAPSDDVWFRLSSGCDRSAAAFLAALVVALPPARKPQLRIRGVTCAVAQSFPLNGWVTWGPRRIAGQ